MRTTLIFHFFRATDIHLISRQNRSVRISIHTGMGPPLESIMFPGLFQTVVWVAIVGIVQHFFKSRTVQAVQTPTLFDICLHRHRPSGFFNSVSVESMIVSLVVVTVEWNLGKLVA